MDIIFFLFTNLVAPTYGGKDTCWIQERASGRLFLKIEDCPSLKILIIILSYSSSYPTFSITE